MSIIKWETKMDLSNIKIDNPEITFAVLTLDLKRQWRGEVKPILKEIKVRNSFGSSILVTINKDSFKDGEAKPKISMNGPVKMTIKEHGTMSLAIQEAIAVYEQVF